MRGRTDSHMCSLSMLRILRGVRVRIRVVWIAAATRVEHRDAALACLMVDSATARPVRGLHCPDVRGRMLRNLLAWIGSLRIGSHARKKAARSLSRREGFARVPMQRSGRIVQEIVLMGRICGREKEKPPDGYPRAFACLGDRGDRSPERDQPWCVSLSRRIRRLPQSFDSAQASASRWKRDVSNGLAVWEAGFIGGLGWNSWCSGSVETKRCCDGRARYTRIFSIANIFFTSRRAARRMDRHNAVVRRANDACTNDARTNENGRPKPPANRIAVEYPIGYLTVADYFGSNTLSIT